MFNLSTVSLKIYKDKKQKNLHCAVHPPSIDKFDPVI